MKKTILLFVTSTLLFACHPKAKKAIEGPSPSAESSVTNGPSDAQLTAAKTKFPGVTMDQLKKGHGIYYGACTRCHGAKTITNWDEKEWVGILDNMAQKAALLPEEKDAVWKYIMGVKLAAK